MDPGDLVCRELVELITDYLDDALPPEERARFEKHLTTCEGCGRYLEQMRTTIRLVGSLGEGSIPTEGREELLRLFRRWKEPSPS